MGMVMWGLVLVLLMCYSGSEANDDDDDQLKEGFYERTCPQAEGIVRDEVFKALRNNAGLAAGLVRMHFHDCFVRGCDGSVLIDSTPTNTAEKDSPVNNPSLRGFEIIDRAKTRIESQCKGLVSCSDILAFAARDSISFSASSGGGISIPYKVPGGRRDGRVSLASETFSNLPPPTFNVTQLTQSFRNKGLTQDDMVTLSGAHSIGQSHCPSFESRLYNFNSTVSQDPSLDANYAAQLKVQCPQGSTNTSLVVPMDPPTPNTLDSSYYGNILVNRGLFTSDQTLASDGQTAALVRANAGFGGAWKAKFNDAMQRAQTSEQKTSEVMEGEPMKLLNRDLLLEILARADGPAIVSAACSSSGLREASQERTLWENLCHNTWPSTKDPKVHDIISSSSGFAKFYTSAFPLVIYNPQQQQQQQQQQHQKQQFITSPSELVSLVDVFFGGVCVFSNVVHGIPMHDTGSWFLDCPFRLDALDGGETLPLMAEGEDAVEEVYKRLEEMRLSWVLLDAKTGATVNLSSWRPTLVERNWPLEGNVLMRFGCALPVDQHVQFDAAECVIELRFRVLGRPVAKPVLRLVEVGLQVEDLDGMHVNGRGSLMVLHQALRCPTRSRYLSAVEDGHSKYRSKQKAAIEMKHREEKVVDSMCALSGAALFAFFCLSLSGYHLLL
ncbi:hypothetical protein J5N97_021788 [Dioscorea zingiberensis]|uniref:peroxidase n=1 Tax=Dioscorea zingiberensis TaxID=325984 RepID=A0A9D5H9Y6_9LILI|nr:hypothetical protein J5N97_021788 [Dioscorea zingiberensis]